jgi:hypothetical protein
MQQTTTAPQDAPCRAFATRHDYSVRHRAGRVKGAIWRPRRDYWGASIKYRNLLTIAVCSFSRISSKLGKLISARLPMCRVAVDPQNGDRLLQT